MNQRRFYWNELFLFSEKICLFSVSEDAQPAQFCAEYRVWGRSPTSIFEGRFVKNQIQKIASWNQLALLAATANAKTSRAEK